MRVLLLGGDLETRAAVARLVEQGGHRLEWRKTASPGGLEAKGCDLLLIEGGSLWREEVLQARTCLVIAPSPRASAAIAGDPARKSAGVISRPAGPSCGHQCGVHQTVDGHWKLRCRLQDRALEAYRARGHSDGSSPLEQAVVFEYQGEAGDRMGADAEEIP